MVSPAPCYLASTSAIEHIAQIGHRGSASLPAVATSLGAPSADVAFELGQRRHRVRICCARTQRFQERSALARRAASLKYAWTSPNNSAISRAISHAIV